jgi:hypothetical protein
MSHDDQFVELESALSHHERAVKAKEKENKWLRPIGFVARLLVYALLFTTAWIFKPDDIISVPLATLTIVDILKTLVWVGVIIWLIRALVNPSEEEIARDGWGALGLVIIAACVLGGIALIVLGQRG